MLRWGIDLGGTKIEIAALDEAGAVRCARRVPTPATSYEDARDALVTLVLDAERELGARGTVGIATPGALSLATGRVKNSNSTLPQRPAAQAGPRGAPRSARCASPTTPTASRSRRRSTARRATRASSSA